MNTIKVTTVLDMPEPSVLTYAIIIFTKMCMQNGVIDLLYSPSSEEIRPLFVGIMSFISRPHLF